MKTKSTRLVTYIIALAALSFSGAMSAKGITAKVYPKRAIVKVATVFQIANRGTTFICGGPVRGRYIPGHLDQNGKFASSAKYALQLATQLRKTKPSKRKPLAAALKREQAYLKRGAAVCKPGPSKDATPTPGNTPLQTPTATDAVPVATNTPGSNPTAAPTATPAGPQPTAIPTQPSGNTPVPTGTPTPTSTPTRTPTNTPTPTAAECIDLSGNSTGCFGLPAGVTGNVTRGSDLYANECEFCHGSMSARTYGQVTNAINNIGSMAGTRGLSTQNVADIVVYLNR